MLFRELQRHWTDLIIEQRLVCSLKTFVALTQCMVESVRYQYVYIMHRLAAIHAAMTALTSKAPRSNINSSALQALNRMDETYFKYRAGSIIIQIGRAHV